MGSQSASGASERCATSARQQGLWPAGSAGHYDGFLLVEHVLPWPSEVCELPVLAALARAAEASGERYRVQAIGGRPCTDAPRLIHYRRQPGPFVRYLRSEQHLAGDGDLERFCAELIAFDAGLEEAAGADLLVCTHGARDRCCGALGTRLFGQLQPDGSGPRTWRTSHTGGHRFAPTAVLLPEGTMWGYLDDEILGGIVDRSISPTAAAAHYRGCTGLDHSEVQAVDGEVLSRLGWEWLDTPRAGTVLSRVDDMARVRLASEAVTWDATVIVSRRIRIPECGSAAGEVFTLQPELVVNELRPR